MSLTHWHVWQSGLWDSSRHMPLRSKDLTTNYCQHDEITWGYFPHYWTLLANLSFRCREGQWWKKLLLAFFFVLWKYIRKSYVLAGNLDTLPDTILMWWNAKYWEIYKYMVQRCHKDVVFNLQIRSNYLTECWNVTNTIMIDRYYAKCFADMMSSSSKYS